MERQEVNGIEKSERERAREPSSTRTWQCG
jgi:hypothetical protein